MAQGPGVTQPEHAPLTVICIAACVELLARQRNPSEAHIELPRVVAYIYGKLADRCLEGQRQRDIGFNWDVLCLGIKQIMAGRLSGNFVGGGVAKVQKVASRADEFLTACATIKAAYDGSVIHSANAIAKRCVPDPLRTQAYGPLQMNVDAGWSYAFDDESSESFIRRCPPSQGGGVAWIFMKHTLHWTAGEKYYRTRTKSRIGTTDERMAVIRHKWDECTDKNQISLVNILGQHDYGYGKVRTHMCCINRHVTSQTHFTVDDRAHLRHRRCSLGPRCDSTRCRSARKQRQGERQENRGPSLSNACHLRVCRFVLGRR